MKRKAQMAIEFLTTYGWAMIALAGVIAAIYLVVDTNASNKVPDVCSFGDSFSCKDYQISKNGVVSLNLKNLVGTDIVINSTICQEGDARFVTPTDLSVASGAEFQLSCVMDKTFSKKTKLDVTVVYVKRGYSFPNSADGVVIGTPTN